MTICSNLQSQFDAAMAASPPDLYNAARVWDLMVAANCEPRPNDPDPSNQSGGHGHIDPK